MSKKTQLACYHRQIKFLSQKNSNSIPSFKLPPEKPPLHQESGIAIQKINKDMQSSYFISCKTTEEVYVIGTHFSKTHTHTHTTNIWIEDNYHRQIKFLSQKNSNSIPSFKLPPEKPPLHQESGIAIQKINKDMQSSYFISCKTTEEVYVIGTHFSKTHTHTHTTNIWIEDNYHRQIKFLSQKNSNSIPSFKLPPEKPPLHQEAGIAIQKINKDMQSSYFISCKTTEEVYVIGTHFSKTHTHTHTTNIWIEDNYHRQIKFLSQKNSNSIPSFKLPPEKPPLHQEAGIAIQKINKDMQSSYFISCKTTEEVYVIGTHFSKTHTHTHTTNIWIEDNYHRQIKFLSQKNSNSIPSFKLPPEKPPLHQEAGIAIQKINKDMQSSYFISCKTTEEVYVIGTHFSKTHTHTHTTNIWIEDNYHRQIKFLSQKNSNSIPSFKLPPEKPPLHQEAGIAIQKINKDMQSSYFISCKTTEEVYVIGTHFSKAHTHTHTTNIWIEDN
ncbi:uncharacterized protein LOC126874983 [Bombus huntii]|uniref:uncharacterized protein LOC126874983 n=1 Tax=Bombus huntii TaxID=85661 RepID=UPI0021AA04B1|nr:uncharacterized protein LOC126874983 [Bombus huntii]